MKSCFRVGLLALMLMGTAAAQQAAQQSAQPSSQQSAGGSSDVIVQVIAGRALPGHEAQYREGRKQHLEFHRAKNDAWAWHAYDVITGENTGAVVTVSAPHKWADHDGREQFVREDQADVARTLTPHATPHEFSIWRPRPDMGRKGSVQPGDPPAPYATVQHFWLAPDAMPAFVENIKRLNAALDKVNYGGPKGLWYQLVNGGEGPHFVLYTPRKNWAEFQGPQETLDEAARRALGAEGATLLANLRKGYRRITTEILRHADDISYHPASR